MYLYSLFSSQSSKLTYPKKVMLQTFTTTYINTYRSSITHHPISELPAIKDFENSFCHSLIIKANFSSLNTSNPPLITSETILQWVPHR